MFSNLYRHTLYTCLLTTLSFLPLYRATAQTEGPPTQTIRGIVTDRDLRIPLPGANVVVLETDPMIGTITNTDGEFVLEQVPLGRRTLQVTYVGYEPVVLPNVLVSSGKEVILNVELREQIVQGQEVVVTAGLEKERPLNDMAAVSARSFSVEETRRYAGGLDDPARMASAFAGVAPGGGVQQNALIIRGNSPKGVLWRLEGIDIPNPNHFAELSVTGGGGLTLFSSQLLSDSDFFTGAFPAEYGNALSGVFDMNFRTGNRNTREHTVQAGLIGVELASEGPFVTGKPSTYLFNYRYSTLGLLMPILPTDAPATYQDLSFKLSFPTRNTGRFEVWGIGGLDHQELEENTDSTEWESEFWDRTRFDMDLGIGVLGLSHNVILGRQSYLHTVAAFTVHRTRWDQERLDNRVQLQPNLYIDNTSSRFIFSSYLNHKFGTRHVNRTGFSAQQLYYDLEVNAAPDDVPPVTPVAGGDGGSSLLQGYTQSRFDVTSAFSINAGVHAQYLALTGAGSIEPRIGLNVRVSGKDAFSLGYGLHSQIEDLRIYTVRQRAEKPNERLDFTRAHHAVLGWDRQLNANTRLKLETYYQYLFDVPVIQDSSYSLLNWEQDWTFDEALVNEGAGRNYGIDLTVERFLNNGFYYLATGSLFRSRYRGGDGIWRNSRYDQGYSANVLFGKEFEIGSKKNLLGLNGRLIFVGGKRRSPVDDQASTRDEEVVYDENRAFTEREPGLFLADFTVTYRVNRRRYSSVWALQIKNVLAAKETTLDYNFKQNRVEEVEEGYPLPFLSYKIEF